jgi:UDP-glucose:(heptosyl)LPS alpha-1,3-glucosyltransferase
MLHVVQVVRRFERDGGMELYVWNLSHELADLGVHVHILCQQSEIKANYKNISINLLKKVPPKPGWLATAIFSYNASRWIKKHTKNDWIIHSHERTSVHNVTTFHGTPFANIRSKPWWKRSSIRISAWLYMEKRELCSSNVNVVFPNSDMVHKELKELYPCIGNRLKLPAYPGIDKEKVKINPVENKGTILFIGKEWKRKGLEKTVQIVKKIRDSDNSVQLWVIGPNTNDIKHLFNDWKGGYRLLGWQNPKNFLPKANLLLHPANYEPYGMVISEATSFGVPVVVSNKCGISSKVTSKSGVVVDVEEDITRWVNACLQELKRELPAKTIGKSWKSLAEDHVATYIKL